MTEKRAAVYNLYWNTRGGGERHAGFLAQALAETGFRVDLLTGEAFDKDQVSSSLGIDLSRCDIRVVPRLNDSAATAVSSDYDLFVNATHLSRAFSFSKKSAYLVYFPTPRHRHWSPQMRIASAFMAPLMKVIRPVRINWLDGVVGSSGLSQRQIFFGSSCHWLLNSYKSNSLLKVEISNASDANPIRARFVFISHGEREVLETTFTSSRRVQSIRSSFKGDLLLKVEFVGSRTMQSNGESLSAKMMISNLRIKNSLRGSHFRALIMRFRRTLDLFRKNNLAAINTYDILLANSEFTTSHINSYWGRDSFLLPPPIATHEFKPRPKVDRTIVSVGRFIEPGHAHSKRQDAMVKTFIRGFNDGRLKDYKLYLLGGVSSAAKEYLRQLKDIARGFPIVVLDNASREELHEVFETSDIFWSATGFGESVTKKPWVFEHFGITTVEAMASGTIPVVIDAGGAVEIVSDRQLGLRWDTQESWINSTVQIGEDLAHKPELRKSCIDRALKYSEKEFEEKVVAIFSNLD
jgi:glycosyltransferase involved in cell wall biosynthesis